MHTVIASYGRRPTSSSVQAVAWYLTIFFVVASVSQLFAFEDFPTLMDGSLRGGIYQATTFAALVVVFEVFAVPFLLSMRVSILMRYVSLVSGWLALIMWLLLSLHQNTDPGVLNAGLFGTKIIVPSGWWLTTFLVALLVLQGFATWGMRPWNQPPHARRSHKVQNT